MPSVALVRCSAPLEQCRIILSVTDETNLAHPRCAGNIVRNPSSLVQYDTSTDSSGLGLTTFPNATPASVSATVTTERLGLRQLVRKRPGLRNSRQTLFAEVLRQRYIQEFGEDSVCAGAVQEG